MTSVVEPFQSRDSFAKYQLFYYEPGTTVFIQTLRWLYSGQQPIEYHLADLVQNNKIQKKYNIDETQKKSLLGLRSGTVQLNELDLTLLYKLIQNVCGLGPCDSISNLWNSKCAPNRQDGIEFLLYTLKTGRNNLAHPSSHVKNLTNEDVDRKCEEMKELLTSIIQKAGYKANVDTNVINDVVTYVINDLERIRKDKHAADSMTPSTKEMILRDLQKWYDEQESNLSDFLQPAERVVVKVGKEVEYFVNKVGDLIQEISEPVCKEVEHVANQVGKEVEHVANQVGKEAEHVANQVGRELQVGAEGLAKGADHVALQIANVFGW